MAEIQKVSYRHEHIMEMMIENPDLRKQDIAARVGVSQTWLSQVISSDAFKREYRRRRAEYVEQVHERTIDKLYDNVEKANEKLSEYLNKPEEDVDPRLVLDIKDKALHRLGYGPGGGGGKQPLGAGQAPSGSVDEDEFKKAQEAAYNQGLRADNAKVVSPEEEEENGEETENSPEDEPEPEAESQGEGQEMESADVERGPGRGEADRPASPFSFSF